MVKQRALCKAGTCFINLFFTNFILERVNSEKKCFERKYETDIVCVCVCFFLHIRTVHLEIIKVLFIHQLMH